MDLVLRTSRCGCLSRPPMHDLHAALAPWLSSLDTRITMSHETYSFWRTRVMGPYNSNEYLGDDRAGEQVRAQRDMVASGETSERQAHGGDRRTQEVGQHSP